MASSYGNQFVSGLTKLFNKNPLESGNCVKVAENVSKAFQRVGANPNIINIADKAGAKYFFDDKGVRFSIWGYHRAVQVGDMVFDSITGTNGMQLTEYTNKLLSYGINPLITPVK